MDNKNSNTDDIDGLSVDDVLQVVRHKGELGFVDIVQSKINIPKRTVLGQMIGFEMSWGKYIDFVGGTKDQPYHDLHALVLPLPRFDDINVDNDEKSDMAQLLHEAKKLSKLFGEYLVLDPAALARGKGIPSTGAHMLFKIQDYRMSIFGEVSSNCDIVVGQLNGWPTAFMVTNQSIPKGEYLWTSYRKEICIAMESKIDFAKACEINAKYFER